MDYPFLLAAGHRGYNLNPNDTIANEDCPLADNVLKLALSFGCTQIQPLANIEIIQQAS